MSASAVILSTFAFQLSAGSAKDPAHPGFLARQTRAGMTERSDRIQPYG
jgi:hypothetical protein